ncbi:MAG: OmpA family protein [Cyclobacteriaceae bacterium]|nr:OmpA family protein [Cyclobacteriaceae bacterium]
MQAYIFLFIKVCLLIFYLLSGQYAYSNYPGENISTDSLIMIYGYVLDTTSLNGEIKPVRAKLVFERMPYGNEIAIISSKDSTGYYEYYLTNHQSYKLAVTSTDYLRKDKVVVPTELHKNHQLKMDIYLQPQFKANQVIRLEKLIFEQGKSSITKESNLELNRLVSLLNEYPKMTIQLEGHTDWRGDRDLNQKLSEERVDEVKNYLVNYGVKSKRIKTKAYGGSQPITRQASVEASEINRRVEVRILKL